MTDPADRFREVRKLFFELARLTPEARKERLVEMEPDAAEVLRALLSAADHPEPALDKPLLRFAERSTGYAEGDKLGPYTLGERLGEGGMGTVYLASQVEPVERVVAVKMISAGLAGEEAALRFEVEGNALARMKHKNIARVLEAGSTEGQPYLVMDYVAGPPITTYCDENKLGIAARLGLFGDVCDAIQHAHQKGIVHRDVKPSNILVDEESGRPIIKVIDFGIAKAIERRPDQHGVTQRFPAVIGTPAYMSPEQAQAKGQDVDIKTDVYSLGVVLYELLAGLLPHDPEKLQALPPDKLRQFIERRAPKPPSRRFSDAGDRQTLIAARRSVDPRKLSKLLRGELDWIVMKALEKEPQRRYASPLDLRRDLERYLGGWPVEAGPPETMYRIKKLVGRRRWVVATIVAALFALFSFMVLLNEEKNRANREAQSAIRTIEVLEGLFEAKDPFQPRKSDLDAREVLASAVAKLDGEPGLDDEVRARLRKSIAVVYRNLGLFAEAESQMSKSLEIRKGLFGDLHQDTLESLHELANIYLQWQRFEEAERLQKKAFERRLKVLGERHLKTAESAANLGVLYLLLGDLEQAERYLATAHAGYRDQIGRDAVDTLVVASNLGQVLQAKGDMEGTRDRLEEVLSGHLRAVGENHPRTSVARNNSGFFNFLMGELEAAESQLRKALASANATVGPDHPHTVTVLGNLGDTMTSLGRPEEGLPFLSKAVETSRTAPQVGPLDLGRSLRKHGRCLTALARYDEAETLLGEAHEILLGLLGPDHPETQKVVENLAELYEQRNRSEKAAQADRE